MNELKCVAGCKHFTGGEIKHHKDCPYYPQSFSKMYDDLEEKVKKINEPAVSVVRESVASGAVCPHFNACQNGGKNEYCDLQTFKEIDCFVG